MLETVGVVETHCPYKQASQLQEALAPNKMRVGFFLGAGCPLAVPDANGKRPLIPDIHGLTSRVLAEVKESEHAGCLDAVLKRLTDIGKPTPNIEDVLSFVRALHDVIGATAAEGVSRQTLEDLDAEICRITNELVKARLPSDETPYHQVASWISAIKRVQAVEIFTSNYDLLMEQALEERRVPYFDGFVGSDRTFFDLTSIELDTLPPRWARLWKVHGSINWWLTKDKEIQRRSATSDGARLLIHPSHLKYEQSRRMPYLAMLDRLRAFLSSERAVLITCGYSYNDQHVNEVILQGLRGNALGICFGLIFSDLDTSAEAVKQAGKHPNLSLLAADGAVIGTVRRPWRELANEDHEFHGIAVEAAVDERCKFVLGDFAKFGNFLAHELADRASADE